MIKNLKAGEVALLERQVLELKSQGKSQEAIATQLNISRNDVRALLNLSGLLKTRNVVPDEAIVQLYELSKSVRKVMEHFNIGYDATKSALARNNIELQWKYKTSPPGVYQKNRRLDKKGYVKWYDPIDPWAQPSGHVYEHRKIMGEHLGRPFYVGENVHHKNGNRSDNRLENLELWVTFQPYGQRPEDLVAYAKEILRRYDRPTLDDEDQVV